MVQKKPNNACPYQKTKQVMQKRKELVRLAYDDKIDKIQDFIDAHPHECATMQWFYLNVLLYALLRKQFKAYAVLQINGFQLPFENRGRTKRFEKLTKDELIEVRQQIRTRFITSDIYLELASDMTPLVRKLMLKTKLSANFKYMEFFQRLRERYEELEAMEDIRPILVIIAWSNRLEIVCDFMEIHAGHTLPGMPFSAGFCDFDNQLIHLCAGFFHTAALANKVHEFIHYTMVVLYVNRGFPYLRNDTEREQVYSKAYAAGEAESKTIANSDLRQLKIFSYENENESPEENELERRLEAIVLPPCIPIEYREETVIRYKQCLTPLFEFYKKYTLPDIIKKSKEIEAEWADDDKD